MQIVRLIAVLSALAAQSDPPPRRTGQPAANDGGAFAAGSASDTVARILGGRLSEILGHQVIVGMSVAQVKTGVFVWRRLPTAINLCLWHRHLCR